MQKQHFLDSIFFLVLAGFVLIPFHAEARCTWGSQKEVKQVGVQFGCFVNRTKQKLGVTGLQFAVVSDSVRCLDADTGRLVWLRSAKKPAERNAWTRCNRLASLGKQGRRFHSRTLRVYGRWGNYVTVGVTIRSKRGAAVKRVNIQTFDMRTNQVVKFRQLFPRRHKAIFARVVHVQAKERMERLGSYCDKNEFIIHSSPIGRMVRFFCRGIDPLTKGQVRSVKGRLNLGRGSALGCAKTACPLHPKRLHRMRILLRSKGLRIHRSQSFELGLPGLKGVLFLSTTTAADPTKSKFFLVRGGVLTGLPKHAANQWTVDKILAVAFRDFDRDGKRDIVVMVSAMTGIGRGGARPFRVTSIFFRKGDRFRKKKRWERALARKNFKTFGALFRWAKKFAR